jgi:predicted hydrocarbon binding protein
MSTTVDALLPLSLLEAVRNVDTPSDGLEVEFVPELRNKRLGLSETVYAQIERYAEAAKRKQPAVHDEAVALAKLIGRRPDAEAVFRQAGRHLAREAYNTVGGTTRRSLHAFPNFLARPWALRVANRLAERYLQGVVRRVGPAVALTVPDSVTLDSIPQGNGCVFYEACFRELLSLLLNVDGTVEHVRCAARGEGACEWRAGWR